MDKNPNFFKTRVSGLTRVLKWKTRVFRVNSFYLRTFKTHHCTIPSRCTFLCPLGSFLAFLSCHFEHLPSKSKKNKKIQSNILILKHLNLVDAPQNRGAWGILLVLELKDAFKKFQSINIED